MSEVLLGLDIGTSSSKGVLVEVSGRMVARAEVSHALSVPRAGWAEHDAASVWWQDFLALCAELLTPGGPRVSGVCCSGIGPCLLAADDGGNPLRPAILYGIDTRAGQEIEEWNERLGQDAILERCGSPLTSQAVGPKLAWLQRHEPDVWAQMSHFFMASSFLVHKLTGEYVLDHHSASQCDPLYDLSAETWIEEWADAMAPGLPLPRLAWPTEIVGHVTAAAARETGIPPGTPVMAGTIDAWAEAASVGVTSPGSLMIGYGTTMFFVAVARRISPDPRLWATIGLFPGSRTLAAGMATSGALTVWFQELVGSPPFDVLAAEAARIPPGSDGLVVLPYFAGERTPIFDARARGLVIGLTLEHRREHLFRAVLEATAYGARHNIETLCDVGGPAHRIVGVGGGTRMRPWVQMISDVTGLQQAIPRETIGASYGDAWLAAIGADLVQGTSLWNTDVELVEPDQESHETYRPYYEIYRALYPATATEMHRLGDLASEAAQAPVLDGESKITAAPRSE